MKLNLKYRGKRHQVTVDDNAGLYTLLALAVETFNTNSKIVLSLNGVDRLRDDETISSMGVVDGDTVHVLEADCAAGSVCSSQRDNNTAKAALVSFISALNPSSPSHVLYALLQRLFLNHGFKSLSGHDDKEREDLEAEWKQLSTSGFFRLMFRRDASSVVVEVTVSIHAMGTSEEMAYLVASFDVAGERQTISMSVDLSREIGSKDSRGYFDIEKIGALAATLRAEFLTPVQKFAVRHSLKSLPDVIMRKIISTLSVRSFFNLTLTCKSLQPLWHSATIWKKMIARDYGALFVNEAEREFSGPDSYFKEYQKLYLRCKAKTQPSMLFRPDVLPATRIEPSDGRRDFPGVGGPNDLNPLGPLMPALWPGEMPQFPRRPRRGPRRDPFFQPDRDLFEFPGEERRPCRRPDPDNRGPPFGFL